MFANNRKSFKRFSHLSMALFSLTFNADLQAKKTLIIDQIDHLVKGGTVKVPKRGKDIADIIEKKPNYFRGLTNDSGTEIIKDIRSPAMGGVQSMYNSTTELLEEERGRYIKLVRFIDSIIDGGNKIMKELIKNRIKSKSAKNFLLKKTDGASSWLKKKNHEDD